MTKSDIESLKRFEIRDYIPKSDIPLYSHLIDMGLLRVNSNLSKTIKGIRYISLSTTDDGLDLIHNSKKVNIISRFMDYIKSKLSIY